MFSYSTQIFFGMYCPPPAEKAMATHSSTFAWKIPWTEEPGGLQSLGSLGVRHNSTTSLSLLFHALEKEMATHSSVLAWRIPGTGEPGGLPSMGSQSRTRLKWLSSSSDSLPCKIILFYSCTQVLPAPHKLHENKGLHMPFLPEHRPLVNTRWCIAPSSFFHMFHDTQISTQLKALTSSHNHQ